MANPRDKKSKARSVMDPRPLDDDPVLQGSLAAMLRNSIGAFDSVPTVPMQAIRALRNSMLGSPENAVAAAGLDGPSSPYDANTSGYQFGESLPESAMIMGGIGAAPMAAKLAKKARASYSSSGIMARQFELPQRPFKDDYKQQADTGMGEGDIGPGQPRPLQVDMEGRPLTAPIIAGRQSYQGGDIRANSEQIAEIRRALSANVSGEQRSSKKLGGDHGRFIRERDAYGNETRSIVFDKNKTAERVEDTLDHETGHLIDSLTDSVRVDSEIPVDKIEKEARSLYSQINGGAASGKKMISPESIGYKGEKANRELMADAVRLYLRNPNAIKTMAPNVAKRIREYVNAHPVLSKVVQFNAVAGIGIDQMAGDNPIEQRVTQRLIQQINKKSDQK